MLKMPNFKKAIFTTDYRTQSTSAIIRTLSDMYSKEHCDMEHAKRFGAELTEGKCMYCGCKLYRVTENGTTIISNMVHFDHVYPASKMNLFAPGNIALACERCNEEKGNMDPHVYYKTKINLEQEVLYSPEEFELKLKEFEAEYQKNFPEHYEVGVLGKYKGEDIDMEEVNDVLFNLFFNKVKITMPKERYTHNLSINVLFWQKLIADAQSLYKPLTAKDVEARIGYANEFFIEKFGEERRVEECTLEEIKEYSNEILFQKRDSKGEVSKYRLLLKSMINVINKETFGDLFEELPTFGKLQDK